jgi:lipoprotein NlpI
MMAMILAVPHLFSVMADEEGKEAPGSLQQRGIEHFFAGRMKEAVADWDRVIALVPSQGPRHWQRGIALYYLENYDEGVAQFESHRAVNPHDVENAVWHYLCAARAPGGSVQKARSGFMPIEGDARVPMKEIHALFSGKGSAEAVLAAASVGEGEVRRNNLCYAHLYLALYHESLGEEDRSAFHIQKAAVEYSMDHYMGKVAQVHHRLRRKSQRDR